MGLDEEARTDTVEMLRGYSPHDDDDPMSWGEKAYRDDILVLAITVAVIGAGIARIAFVVLAPVADIAGFDEAHRAGIGFRLRFG